MFKVVIMGFVNLTVSSSTSLLVDERVRTVFINFQTYDPMRTQDYRAD